MKRTLHSLIAAGVALACSAYPVEGSIERIRVWKVQPACFDYMFTSSLGGTGDKTVLSLNHRGGKTFFVRIGDRLGNYTVKEFEPGTTRVFNPSINAYQTRKSGKVSLLGPGDKTVVLEQNKPLPQAGWLAYLISLDSSEWTTARDGDKVLLDELEMQVRGVTTNDVTVSVNGRKQALAAVAPIERDNMVARWAQQAREQKEGEALAAAAERVDHARLGDRGRRHPAAGAGLDPPFEHTGPRVQCPDLAAEAHDHHSCVARARDCLEAGSQPQWCLDMFESCRLDLMLFTSCSMCEACVDRAADCMSHAADSSAEYACEEAFAECVDTTTAGSVCTTR